MNLEIIFGGNTYYINNSGNQYRACMDVLKQVAESGENIPISDFEIYDINNFTWETVELDLVLAILNLSTNFEGVYQEDCVPQLL